MPRQLGEDRPRALDDTALARRAGPLGRLRALGGSNRLVIGATTGLVLVVGAVLAVAGMLAFEEAVDAGGVAVAALVAACGAGAIASALRQAGEADVLAGFAADNDLVLVRGAGATHYAGGIFADGSHLVDVSVRTRDEPQVEVGDRIGVTAPPDGLGNRPELFLRLRLRHPIDPHALEQVVDADLHAALERLAGSYRLEAGHDELTVFGTEPLAPTRPGRVRAAITLADRLAARAHEVHQPARRDPGPTPTRSGVPLPPPARAPHPPRRPRGPLAVAAATVLVLVVGPLLFAVVMSTLDDRLLGRPVLASLVVSVVVAGTLAGVYAVVRVLVSPRRDAQHSDHQGRG